MNLGEQQINTILKQSQHFRQFKDDLLLQLIALGEEVEFAAQETVLPEGIANERVFVLLQGQVDVIVGGEHIVSFANPGDLIGEMSVISKNPTSALVRAQGPVSIFAVSVAKVHQTRNLHLIHLLDKVFLDILNLKLVKTTATAKDFSGEMHFSAGILESVLSSMSDGVMVTNAEGRLMHCNHSFSEMVGAEVLPVDLADWPAALGLFQPDQTSPLATGELPTARVLTRREQVMAEIWVKNPQKPQGVWLQAVGNPLHPEGSPQIQGAVAVFRDVTKQRDEEAALIKAKEEAENLAKAKSNLLSVMSHELRTPLNAVLGMSQLLQQTALDPEQTDLVQSIRASGEGLFAMVNNILDLNQLESGVKLQLKANPLSLQRLLTMALERETPFAQGKKLPLRLDLEKLKTDFHQGDETRLLQVLVNLLNNAIKFSQRGEITLSARHRGKELLIEVSDQGIGIAEDQLERVFEPFVQADGSYSRSYDGMGIGLTLAKRLAELMQGRVKLSSTLGQGTKATLVLPADPDAAPAPAETPAPPSFTLDETFAQAHPWQVLVAEDNLQNQKLIGKVLAKLGYQAGFAENGKVCSEMMLAGNYNLILMDLQMPEMDGLDAAKEILGRGQTPVIIALTANAAEGVQEACLAAGMKGYLTKPLRINELAEQLAK